MLPVTVPASRGDAAHLDAGRRVSPALLALDEHLFNPDASQWLVIDSGNTAVPRTVVPSLVDGLELIGKGRIAALVGHLRDGVGVVDIDVPGDFGNFLAAEIADWLRRRDCWVLERPSGGAKGRWHIFFAHSDFHYAPAAARAGFAAAVSDYLTALAEDVKVPRGELDLREAVRPLSSPHRFGAVTRPKGDLREALRGLKRLLPDPPSPTPLRPRAKVKPADAGRRSTATGSDLVVPLPLQRWKRELRAEWRKYLLTGEIPAGSWAAGATKTRNADEVDRSLVEAACTRELVWAVGDPQIAWRIIRESHPTVMTKAKHQGEAWWLNNWWNKTVEAADAFRNTTEQAHADSRATASRGRRGSSSRPHPTRRAGVDRVPHRQRPALLLVGHHLLDRVLRAGTSACPAQNAISSSTPGSPTARPSGLPCASSTGDSAPSTPTAYPPSRGTRRATSLKSTPPARWGDGKSPTCLSHTPTRPRPLVNPPPHEPQPVAHPPGLPGPTDLTELVVKSGLVEKPEDVPSKSQRSTAKTALAALSHAGLATVDEDGRWSAATRPRSMNVDRRACGVRTPTRDREEERAAYRVGADLELDCRESEGHQAQAKQKAWWDNLSPAARAERSSSKRLEFEQMSLTQQSALKARIAERRARAGLDSSSTTARGFAASRQMSLSLVASTGRRVFRGSPPPNEAHPSRPGTSHRRRYGLPTQQPASCRTTGETPERRRPGTAPRRCGRPRRRLPRTSGQPARRRRTPGRGIATPASIRRKAAPGERAARVRRAA